MNQVHKALLLTWWKWCLFTPEHTGQHPIIILSSSSSHMTFGQSIIFGLQVHSPPCGQKEIYHTSITRLSCSVSDSCCVAMTLSVSGKFTYLTCTLFATVLNILFSSFCFVCTFLYYKTVFMQVDFKRK